jgi:mannose-6-phosphate isomerase-like protein (cupin superfamily)
MLAELRCVVTGHTDGRAEFVSDGTPTALASLPGATIWRLLHLDGLPRTADDGESEPGPPIPLVPGGISVQVMQLDGRDDWPEGGGWRQVDTLDFTVIIKGTLVVELEAGATTLGPGDTLVQRGTRHRMRAADGPVRALVTHLAPGDGSPTQLHLRPGTDGTSGVRRVVTGTDSDGRSMIVHDGEPGFVFRPGGRAVLTDVWQTGGPVSRVDQGGDVTAPWQVEPVDSGVSVGIVELGAGDYSDDANWHTTATIDVDVILSGGVELHLPYPAPVVLGPGDVVVQRGTNHRWQPVGDVPLRMATVMLSVGH